MKIFFLQISAVFAAFTLAVLPQVSLAKSSPARMKNNIYVSFHPAKNVSVEEGIRYSPNCPDPDVKLDVYYPKGSKSSEISEKNTVPCIILIHGGGWAFGNEKKFAAIANHFAREGYVCFCISYRLLPEYEISDIVEDVKTALYYARKNAKKYGGNPDKIGAIGGSAGAHLSAILATTSGSELSGEIFSDGTSDKIQAFVGMGTPSVIDKKMLKKYFPNIDPASVSKYEPARYVSKNTPPTLLLHSEHEKVVPLSLALPIKDACNNAGVPCEVKLYNSSNHAFWNVNFYNTNHLESWNDALKFFDKILKGK